MDAPVLPPAELYINRELSLLEFNQRVLEQARDSKIPILERLRFLCISCTNLDEFFEIRVAALKQRLEIGAPAPGPDKMTAQHLLDEIRHRAVNLVRQQYELLNTAILPTLVDEQIRFPQRSDWSEDQKRWMNSYFRNEIVPVLTPSRAPCSTTPGPQQSRSLRRARRRAFRSTSVSTSRCLLVGLQGTTGRSYQNPAATAGRLA